MSGRLVVLALAAVAALAAPEATLAHGLGGVKDLPVPGWLFLYGGATVLVVSFAALAALWRTPKLDSRASGRPLPETFQNLVLAPVVRLALATVGLALFFLVWLAAAFGDRAPFENIAPTFVYVLFWLGLPAVVVLFGNVWSVLNPWRAAADAVAWIWSRLGRSWRAAPYPDWLGRWPAAALLFASTALELAYTDPPNPRALALAIALYSCLTWLRMGGFGRAAWLENGDGFSVYFALLSRIAPFAVRDRDGHRELVLRTPLSALTARETTPGTLAVVAVMLGSVAFDGFSRTRWWQDRIYSLQTSLGPDSPALANLAQTVVNLSGLAAGVLFVASAYLAAVAGAEFVAGRGASLAGVFVGSLVPIALVYAVAHYFSLFIVQSQFAIPLLSDPLGRGWDLIGTADFQPELAALSPNTTWYVQVAALVLGHVAGLVVAHDRAVAVVKSPRTAVATQYPMLALMVLYTVGGLWLLSLG